MVELLNSRWMHVAMAMAALTTGCAAGEAGADEIDMDEAEAVEVEETSQALYGDGTPRSCGGWGGNRWNNRPRHSWNRGGGLNPWGGALGGPSWGGAFGGPSWGGDPWSGGYGRPPMGGYSPGFSGSNYGYGYGGDPFGYAGYGGGCNRW